MECAKKQIVKSSSRTSTTLATWRRHNPCLRKGEQFATTIQLLLSLRSLEPKLTIDQITKVIVPQTTRNTIIEFWLEPRAFKRPPEPMLAWTRRSNQNAQFPQNFGEQASDAELDITGCTGRSMDGALSGRLLQV
jgi:hypothetical protein